MPSGQTVVGWNGHKYCISFNGISPEEDNAFYFTVAALPNEEQMKNQEKCFGFRYFDNPNYGK